MLGRGGEPASKHGALPVSFARSTGQAVAHGLSLPRVTCTPTPVRHSSEGPPGAVPIPAGFHHPPRPEGAASAAAGNCPGDEKSPAGCGRRPRPGTRPRGPPAPKETRDRLGPRVSQKGPEKEEALAPKAARRGLTPPPVPLKLENPTPPSGRASRPASQQKSRGAAAAVGHEEGRRRARGERHAGPRPGLGGSHPSLQYPLTSRDDGVKPCTEAMYRSTSALLRLIAPPAWTPGRDRPAPRPKQSPFPVAERLKPVTQRRLRQRRGPPPCVLRQHYAPRPRLRPHSDCAHPAAHHPRRTSHSAQPGGISSWPPSPGLRACGSQVTFLFAVREWAALAWETSVFQQTWAKD